VSSEAPNQCMRIESDNLVGDVSGNQAANRGQNPRQKDLQERLQVHAACVEQAPSDDRPNRCLGTRNGKTKQGHDGDGDSSGEHHGEAGNKRLCPDRSVGDESATSHDDRTNDDKHRGEARRCPEPQCAAPHSGAKQVGGVV